MRSFHRAKAQFVAATEHDVAWSAHIVLARLATEGPLRAGELAELIQSDPSTVSRQVASIVKDGLVKREADPDDGRASLLVLTEEGRRVYSQQLDVRSRHMARMLRDWSEQDCRQLTFAPRPADRRLRELPLRDVRRGQPGLGPRRRRLMSRPPPLRQRLTVP